jgi:hypothetical protein
MSTTIAFGLTVHFMRGMPGRFGITRDDLDQINRLEKESHKAIQSRLCSSNAKNDPTASNFVTACMSKTQPNVLLLGDSHAAHLLPGLASALPDVNFILIASGGCRPLRGKDTRPTSPQCPKVVGFVFETLLPKVKFDGVILSAAWESGDVGDLDDTLRYVKGFSDNVTVFGPIIKYREALPILLLTKPAALDEFRRPETPVIDHDIRAVAERNGVAYVSLFDQLCDPTRCVSRVGNLPLQWDDEHLTLPGSEWLIGEFVKAGRLEQLRKRSRR